MMVPMSAKADPVETSNLTIHTEAMLARRLTATTGPLWSPKPATLVAGSLLSAVVWKYLCASLHYSQHPATLSPKNNVYILLICCSKHVLKETQYLMEVSAVLQNVQTECIRKIFSVDVCFPAQSSCGILSMLNVLMVMFKSTSLTLGKASCQL